jgi:hypothetical protein
MTLGAARVLSIQIALGALSFVSDEVLDPERNLSPTWGPMKANMQRCD